MTTVTASLPEAYSRFLSAGITEGMLHPLHGRLLRDALTAAGVRASLSVVLQDPRGTRKPSSLAQLWSTGELGSYRTDTPDSPVLEVIPVVPGDLLATALGLLEDSFRFAAATSAAGE